MDKSINKLLAIASKMPTVTDICGTKTL